MKERARRKDRDGEKKIHSMINYPHCVPEKRWGERTVGTWGIHKDTGSIHTHTQSSSATKTYESLSCSVSKSSLNPPEVLKTRLTHTHTHTTEVEPFMIAWINTLTLHSLTLVIFRKNKLDPHLIFEEIAQEFKKKKSCKKFGMWGRKNSREQKKTISYTLHQNATQTQQTPRHTSLTDNIRWGSLEARLVAWQPRVDKVIPAPTKIPPPRIRPP